MRTTWLLVIGCGLVLGGAWLASRLLLSDVPAPAPAAAAPVAVARTAAPVEPPMNVAGSPPALAPQKEPGLVPPVVGQPGSTPTAKAHPQGAPEDLGPAETPLSPFQGASEELDYAEGILGEATPTRERLESSLGVFKRCVEQEPANQRCYRGLSLARELLGLKLDQPVSGKNDKLDERPLAPSNRGERLNQMRLPAPLK